MADNPGRLEYLRTGVLINEQEMRLDNPCSLFYRGLDGLTYILCLGAGGIFQILPVDGEGTIDIPVEQPPNFWVPPTVDIRDWVGNGSQEAINTNIGFHREFRQNKNDELRGNTNLFFGPLAYDGSDLFVRIIWQLTSSPVSGKTVKWDLDFALVKADGTEDAETKSNGALTTGEIDISSFTPNRLVTTDFPVMDGELNAVLLEMNLSRDGSTDSYNKVVHLFATVLFKADTVL